MKNSQELIKQLKEERTKLQITKNKLGENSNTSHTTIARIENGEVMPTLETFIRIADSLGYDVELVKKDNSPISISKHIEASREYIGMLYGQEEKDINNAIKTLERIRKK